MIKAVSAADAARMISSGLELGVFDVREIGPHSEGHPLFAAPAPYSLLEDKIGSLAPCVNAALLLFGDGNGLGRAAAEMLGELGYSDIAYVKGGVSGWNAAGHAVFQGVHVPSKTLGELALDRLGPGSVTPGEVAGWLNGGRRFAFFDCRPPKEFETMAVPGSVCMPAAELAHRMPVLDPEDPVVLTCAGRTRGFVGNAWLSKLFPDRTFLTLENGTQGWVLAGCGLLRGAAADGFPELSPSAARETKRLADRFLTQEKIPVASARMVSGFIEDRNRTTYCLDVRSDREAADDTLAAFTHCSAGQAVQQSDSAAPVLRSRVVFADDLGLRAAMAACWLRKLGHDVFVARIDDDLRSLAPASKPNLPDRSWPELNASEGLAAVEAGQAAILDFRPSGRFSQIRISGSHWLTRPQIREHSESRKWLLVDDCGVRARLAARELERLGRSEFAVIKGGFQALIGAGARIEEGGSESPIPSVDEISFARGRHEGNLDASRLYLEWEKGLAARLSAQDRAAFEI